MNKYFVIFRIPLESMDQWAKDVAPEERKKQGDGMMKSWQEWSEKNKAAIVDTGMPFGKTKRVSKSGVEDIRNDLNYGMVIQAASHDEAAKIIADNPHVQMIPTSFADVMEISHTGM